MFSFISLIRKGQPLVTYETVVKLIGATRTKTGLKVTAKLDTAEYEAGVQISNAEMDRLNIKAHSLHPQWNYTISSHHPTQK